MPNNQLWAIIEGTLSLTQCHLLRFISFGLKGHQDPCNKMGP